MRAQENNGYGAITGHSYQVKTMAVTAGSASGYTAAEIEQLFSMLDPAAVTEAGKAHADAASTLHAIAESLITHVTRLQANWSGAAAQSALPSFQQLHASAMTLADAATQTGDVLTWLGGILPTYKNYTAPSNGIVGDIESLFGRNPQNEAAQAKMEELNDRLVQANGGLPSNVTVNLPALSGSAGHSPATTGGIGPGGGAGAAASGVGLAGGAGSGVGVRGGSGGSVSGVTPRGSGATGGVGGTGGLGTGPASPGAPTHLAGLPPGGGPGTGTGTSPGGGIGSGGGVPGGGSPGGAVGPGGPDPVGLVPMPGGGGPGGGQPGDGEPGDLGGIGDGSDPVGVGADPVPVGVGTAPAGDPAGVGDPVGVGPNPVGVGSVGTDPFGGDGTGAGRIGGNAGGDGLIGEDLTGAAPGDSAVIGSDGMIGTGPGGVGAGGLDAGFADSGLGAGDTGATGFVGADGAAAGTDGAMADAGSGSGAGGFPMAGSGSGGRPERERRRQAWMAEDADLWAGEAGQVPPTIGG